MKRNWIALGLGLMLALTACEISGAKDRHGADQAVGQNPEQPMPLDQKEREAILTKLDERIAEAENAFGLRLHRELTKTTGKTDNLVLSPYSISTALALAYNGSAGQTAAEMEKVLGWKGMGLDKVNEGNSQLKSLLEKGAGVTLNIANAVWVQKGYAFQENYLNRVKTSYGAEARSADLSSQAFVEEINGWVDQKTNGMIKGIYQNPPEANSVLVNAIYFNGGWMDEFNPEYTKEENFSLPDGSVKKVPMMRIEEGFGYKESKEWQAVRLPYGDGRMHMLVILPRESSSLEQVHKKLWKDPSVWMDDYSFETVKLGLPKFKAESDLKLEKVLDGLGMKSAVDPQKADFSGMIDGLPLFIGEVKQKSIVDVDEKGTKAAAVTAVGMPTSAAVPMEPVEMTVNRPFFFAIEDRDTRTWIFMGSVNRP